MGWWSETIMGGDWPLDLQGEFEDRFGNVAPDEDDELAFALPPFRIPTAAEGIAFLNEFLRANDSDNPYTKQVTGFLMIERGAPFNDKLREMVIEGIDEEDTSTWNDPSERIKELAAFRKIVEAYPNEGTKIELPHQLGLFEKFAQGLGKLS